mgnify:FL=1
MGINAGKPARLGRIAVMLLASALLFAGTFSYSSGLDVNKDGLVLLYHFDKNSSYGENDTLVHDW